jgi:hypothetical protein
MPIAGVQAKADERAECVHRQRNDADGERHADVVSEFPPAHGQLCPGGEDGWQSGEWLATSLASSAERSAFRIREAPSRAASASSRVTYLPRYTRTPLGLMKAIQPSLFRVTHPVMVGIDGCGSLFLEFSR